MNFSQLRREQAYHRSPLLESRSTFEGQIRRVERRDHSDNGTERICLDFRSGIRRRLLSVVEGGGRIHSLIKPMLFDI